MHKEFNSPYLCLILKYSNATNNRNFKPIGLCNTQYKITPRLLLIGLSFSFPTSLGLVNPASWLEEGCLTRLPLSKNHYPLLKNQRENASIIHKIDQEKAFNKIELSFIR